ncbi:hypothetical protein C5Y96_05735 [Blastopirellula marina]|uniref:Terminase large subunit GpA endonuclease domain-containing protein n=1 Tax=Blastopirellula marina TaxID=124 RepID=A0A2S8G4H9_9BACT|nr:MULTISPECIES: terminase gpA endonuclease subunit [Pirellulaceae]PQO39355.1 hypothetical protein C5Y96_05735 [Blastopirellula marina]RCS55663.1 hypothetical protein DTL36_05745 [Bremerella cremea]
MPKKKPTTTPKDGGTPKKRATTKRTSSSAKAPATKKTTKKKTAKKPATKKAPPQSAKRKTPAKPRKPAAVDRKPAKKTPTKTTAKKKAPTARSSTPPQKRATPAAGVTADNTDAKKKRAEYRRQHSAKSSREDSSAVRDIGEIPKVADPERRAAALADFLTFCLTYFAHRFPLEFSEDHKRVAGKIQAAILEGALSAVAMPRGSGKTTLTEVGCLFALVCGKHDFLVLIGSDKESATDMLESIKGEIETNDLLAEDFPEVCFPVRALEGISNRCKGQTYHGVRTRITWSSTRVTLPTIKGSQSSGVTIRCTGITGRIRGMKHAMSDGRNVRPTLVIIDDPQTDEAADSDTQVAKLERTLNGAILGLAGPGVKISGIMPCTVIRAGDLADRILDMKLSPEWNGEKCRMLYAWPDNLTHWETYNEIRVEDLQAGRLNFPNATKYYLKNQRAMKKNARVAWPARHNKDEVDALQHAMNLWFKNPYSFMAEYQNDPPDELAVDDEDICTADHIAAKTSGYQCGLVPNWATRITIGVDVHKELLYWLALATDDQFTGQVISYGTWPEQPMRHFQMRKARPKISDITRQNGLKGAGLEGRLTFAMQKLVEEQLAVRRWEVDGGGEMVAVRIVIDMGYQANTVRNFIRNSPMAGILWPSKGLPIKATGKPMDEWSVPKGTHTGPSWRISPPPRGQAVRHIDYDANFWKTFIHARLAMAKGDPASHALYKQSPTHHRLLAEHVANAEKPKKLKENGREVIEWKLKSNKPDNHLLDCYQLACLGASHCGARLPEQQPAIPQASAQDEYEVNF